MDENLMNQNENVQEQTLPQPEENNEPQAPQPVVCSSCGAPILDGMNFCPVCGKAKTVEVKPVCKKCGAALADGQMFCPSCGQSVAAPVKKKKSKLPVIIGVAAAVIVVIVAIICSSGSGANFEKVYNDYGAGVSGITLSSDKKSISLDTNPFDIDDYTNTETFSALSLINDALGLPDSLYSKMLDTSALDGRVTDEYDGIKVSWKYHPDNGLEVVYEKVD